MKSVTNTQLAEPINEPVTVARDSRQSPIIAIRGGLPLGTAFDQLSVLLSSGISAVESVAFRESETNGDPSATWSAVHNLNMAFDLVQSMHQGYIEHRKQLEG